MLAVFGLIMALSYDSPWYVWVIGFFCILLDADYK